MKYEMSVYSFTGMLLLLDESATEQAKST